ncbi:MAG TPA: hypothetical protein DCQ83_06805 [Fibrobacteres bacterium]|nr:hypothetical protein [Fibrobacterota bacterium]
MKRFPTLAFAVLTLGISAGFSAPDTPKPSDAVIQVGKQMIRKGQIDSIVALLEKAQSVYGEITASKREEMRKLVSSNLIGQELLEQEAKALHVQATPAEVDSALKLFKKNFPDEASFKKTLKDAGDNETKVKVKLSRQIRADKVLATRIKKPEMPSDKEMKDFWDEHKKDFPINDSLRALQILLLTDAKTPKDETDKKSKTLEMVRSEILKDSARPSAMLQRFMAAAAQIGEGREAKTGGDLQRFLPSDFNAEFRKQLQTLRVGQLSPVFKTPLGLHLVLLIEKYDGKYDSYKLQVIQNLVKQKAMMAGGEMRQFLKGLAAKYPVKYLKQGYQDSSEGGIY